MYVTDLANPLTKEGRVTARDEIERLEARRARHQDSLKRIDADLGPQPLRRDRSWFFYQLLNGDRDTYERVHPLWKERRQVGRELRRIGLAISAAKRQKVMDEGGYRLLVSDLAREKSIDRACKEMLKTIASAQRGIDRVNKTRQSEASRSTLESDVKEISELLRGVRRQADALQGKMSVRRLLDPHQLAKLDLGFPSGNDPKKRNRQLRELVALLSSLRKTVKSLRKKAKVRMRELEAKQLRYRRDRLAHNSE